MNRMRALVLLVLAASIAACSGGGTAPQTNDTVATEVAVDLPASTVTQMKVLLEEKAARTTAQRKISSQLLYAKTNRFPALEQSLMRHDDRGRVLCDVKGDVDAGLERQIEIAGGTVVATSAGHRSARAWLPLQSLEALAEQSIVTAIRPALAVATNRAEALDKALRKVVVPVVARKGSVTSAGSKAHGADNARKFYNTNGAGIKVGVLSDSDDFREQSIALGDLPADTTAIAGQDGRPGTGRGTAMMEIIHDVAPGAKLFFATGFTSPESFADNIRRLRFEFGCDVIVADIQYFFESPYQDDIIAQAVHDVTENGALYFAAAGDDGNLSDGTSGTWEGDFRSGGALVTIGGNYNVHDFGRKVISNRVETGGGPLRLQWSDPGTLALPGSANDYDLFVLSADLRQVVAASTDIQNGAELPHEFLGVFVPAGLRVVVAAKPTAATRAIRVQLSRGELGLATSGSISGHAAAASAFTVGAVDAASAGGEEFTEGPFTPVELSSADGNRTIFYNTDNTQIGTGSPVFAGAAGQLRRKPDAVAADGVTTTLPPTSGLNPFFGTSAAAAHAAGIAALIKAAVPTADRTRIYNALRNGALDIEAAGVDVDSGHGVLSAIDSLERAGARPSVFLELGNVTVTPTSGSTVNPGGSAQLIVQVINAGLVPASAVSATLTTTTPGVTITSPTAAYPTIAPASAGANLTPFAFTLSPSVPCGARVHFTVTVSFTGRGTNPTALNFSVQTGGAGANIVSPYAGAPIAITDNGPLGIDIPLTVTGAGLINSLALRIDGTTCNTTGGSTTVGIDHTFVGDLRLRLRSPSGTAVTVIDRAGGPGNDGNNFCQTVLRDGVASSIQTVSSAQAPFIGTFAPAQSLSAFAGENANGTWTLNVSDVAAQDTGTVRAFSLVTTGFSCTP